MTGARFFLWLLIGAVITVTPAASTPNNVYGVHTFIQDAMSPGNIATHLTWARTLTGPGGHVKQLIYPITPGCAVDPAWQSFAQGCYDRQLIPILRLGTVINNGVWQKPPTDPDGSFTTMANTQSRT